MIQHKMPCFECVCNPICRNKYWTDCLDNCSILIEFFIERRYDFPLSHVIGILKTKRVFKMKYGDRL